MYNLSFTSMGLAACLALLPLAPALAGPAEAREAARLNNCTPKKIDVFQQSIGRDGKTVYRVSCTLAKTKDEAASSAPDALLVQCDGMLCTVLRPVSAEAK